MDPAFQLFILLVLIGIFLIGAEIFLPGGVIGFLGGLSLAAAAATGFFAFGPQGGFLCAFLIIVFSASGLFIWVRIFPQTRMGRSISLSEDGSTFKASPEDLSSLVGKEGVALTILRPAGMAQIDGRRLDVVADGMWIEIGKAVTVIKVEGNRILVRDASGLHAAANGAA